MPKKPISPIQWAPKVKQDKLRRLYVSDASGIRDEELVNDVGLDLYLRCQSILDVTAAVKGAVRCHGCGALIEHHQEPMLCCSACGWRVVWKDYQRSYREKQLFGGAALPFFQAYVAQFRIEASYREKMLAIDELIHQFHWYQKADQLSPQAVRPTAANLIVGRGMREVLAFLDSLTYCKTGTVVRLSNPDR